MFKGILSRSRRSQDCPSLPQALEAARTIGDEEYRTRALQSLAHYLPEVSAEALEAALTIKDEYSRAEVLQGLAPNLPQELLLQALEAARAIGSESSRAQVLQVLAP